MPKLPETDPAHADDAAQTRIPVAEERLVVTKDVTQRLAGRVQLRTQETDVPVSEMLATQNVQIERKPVDRIVAKPPVVQREGNVTIIPVVEEVLVRQYRIREEVHITSLTETSEWTGTVSLRQQTAEIDRLDDDPTTA